MVKLFYHVIFNTTWKHLCHTPVSIPPVKFKIDILKIQISPGTIVACWNDVKIFSGVVKCIETIKLLLGLLPGFRRNFTGLTHFSPGLEFSQIWYVFPTGWFDRGIETRVFTSVDKHILYFFLSYFFFIVIQILPHCSFWEITGIFKG